MKYIVSVLTLVFMLSACSDFLDPRIQRRMSQDQLITQPDQIAGIITYAYSSAIQENMDKVGSVYGNNNQPGAFLDCATDNAIVNQEGNNVYRMASTPGWWTTRSTFIGGSWGWGGSYEKLRDIETFFDIVEKHDVTFLKINEEQDSIYRWNLFGEAYFIKAFVMTELLRNYGGIDRNGDMVGVPIVKGKLDVSDYEELPRASYGECVDFIEDALDSAMVYLPEFWDNSDNLLTSVQQNLGRPTKGAALALRARVRLHAASPAYTVDLPENEKLERWSAAAEAAKDAIDFSGTLPDIYSGDVSKDFYNDPQSDEVILSRIEVINGVHTSFRVEQEHAVPTLLGKGRCNPTQNLVDAFPMADGFPAGQSPEYAYGTDKSMYENRDPRFYNTIYYDGATVTYGGDRKHTVGTREGGIDTPGNGRATVNNSTRTGYYLKKWLSTRVDLTAGAQAKDVHYGCVLRKAELYLIFAEALNEAAMLGGATSIDGLTAKDAIGMIRERALKLGAKGDKYLDMVAGSPIHLRELIRNERRVELAFEGHRFYDLRRWQSKLDIELYKINISAFGEFSREPLYTLAHGHDNYYNPIHQSEINKTTKLVQNQGW